jgi:hypothetical protein
MAKIFSKQSTRFGRLEKNYKWVSRHFFGHANWNF